MSSRIPQEMRRFAKVLMAGEQVLVMDKPEIKSLVVAELVLAAGGFVVLFILTTMFSDLPVYLKAAASFVFALAGTGLIHFLFATTTYIITDKRVLIVSDMGTDLRDSCELDEVTSIRRVAFANQLVIERTRGNPMRLVALKDRDGIEEVLVGS